MHAFRSASLALLFTGSIIAGWVWHEGSESPRGPAGAVLPAGEPAHSPGAGAHEDGAMVGEADQPPSIKEATGLRAPDLHFFEQRAFPLGRIPVAQWQAARTEATVMQRAALEDGASRGAAWDFRGPTNVGGRITDIAVHPTDANVVYAGTAEGGVLKTTDGGNTWAAIFDDQPVLTIGAVAIDPLTPNTVYVGTGEVNPGGGSVAYGGQGVFRSTDAGASWEPIGLEATGSIGRIVIDPNDPQRIFVAALGLLWATNPERGVYRTTNGGTDWEQVLFVADDAGCVDLMQRPDNPDVLFAAIWQRLRQPEAYDYGGPRCGVYRSTDGGDSWAPAAGGLPTPSTTSGRIGLSLCRTQPDVMHAMFVSRTGSFAGLYRTTNGGTSWTRTSDGTLASAFSTYGWWFGNVRTHPSDGNRIFALDLPFYRSINGGSSWSEVGEEMHVDHHALAFGPGANPVLYAGNDGGVYKSVDGGNNWAFLPNQPITQFYRVALDAGNPDALYGGAQDNGTVRTLDGVVDQYESIFGGDGFQPLVHPTNSNAIWAQYQYGSLSYSGNGGGSWSGATGNIPGGDRRNWNSPLEQDPTNPARRYFGTQRLYRSNTNTSWTALSPDLTGGPHSGNSGQVNGVLTTIGISPLDGNVLWTGSDDGFVQVSTNGGTNWTNVSAGLPGRWITSVRPDPFDVQTAYVTVSGFRWNESLPRVYKTTNRGTNWTAIASNLPDAPANDIMIDPEAEGRLFLATDVGMFESLNDGGSWSPLGTGLPNVVVTDLAFDPVSRRLVAATYGRSLFSLTVPEATDVAQGEGESVDWLLPPAPNPTADGAWISWNLDGERSVELEIFAASGRSIRAFEDIAAADARFYWDGRDSDGRMVPAGAYFVRARSEREVLGTETILVTR